MAGILALIAAGLGSRIVLDQNCTDCPYPGKCLGKTDCEEYGNKKPAGKRLSNQRTERLND